MKKIFCSILSVFLIILSLTVFVGCENNDIGTEIKVDDTKVQIYVGTYDGGVGDKWIYNVASEFEKEFADYILGDKTGVQIVVDKAKNGMDGPTLLGSILSSRDEIFFTEDVYYYDYLSKQNVIMDITDIVGTPLSEFGESKSILDKLNPTYDSYYNSNGKYYALPFYEGFYGMVYDVDLFEKYNFFFKDGASADSVDVNSIREVEGLFVQSNDEKRSSGPDGVYDTLDDGLPTTHSDFYALMTLMKAYGVVPFIWTGAYTSYVQRFAGQVWADYEGKDDIRLNMDLSGVSNDLIDNISGNSISYMDATTITSENASLLQKQAGKYYALDFIKNIVSDSSNYSSLSFSGSLSHTGAQDEFLIGSLESEKDTIAILIDGNWWESEANATFTSMEVEYGEETGKMQRRFAFMPVPKATRSKVGSATVYDSSSSSCFIRGNVEESKQYIVKEFFRFCHTQKALDIFTQTTSMTRAFEYELSNLDNVSYYAKSVFELHKNGGLISSYSNNEEWLKNTSKYKMENWAFTSEINGNTYSNPFTTFKNYPSITVVEYFNGLYKNYSK